MGWLTHKGGWSECWLFPAGSRSGWVGGFCRESWCVSVHLVNDSSNTVRRRRSRSEMVRVGREVVRRSEAGEPLRAIARSLCLSRTSVAKIMAEHRAAQGVTPGGERTNALGIPLVEAAMIDRLISSGFRYRAGEWHDPQGRPCGTNNFRELPAPGC